MAGYARCHNPKADNYPDYGGRGIKVCEEWRKDSWAFVKDVGKPAEPSYQLDRVNTDGDYEPENVRWASPAENSQNRRSVVPALDKARKIRELFTSGLTLVQLAQTLNVSIGQMESVISNKHWRTEDSKDLRKRILPRHLRTSVNYESLHRGIVLRCYKVDSPSYQNYGAKGVTIASEWHHSPKQFRFDILREIGDRPSPRHSLDRIDPTRGYVPGNLRWATNSEQNLNKRRTNFRPAPSRVSSPEIATDPSYAQVVAAREREGGEELAAARASGLILRLVLPVDVAPVGVVVTAECAGDFAPGRCVG